MLENIKEKKLSNGLKIIALKKSDTPVVSAQVWYKTGSVYERDGIRGISHMLEHMMFRGSANVASEEHTSRVNDIGGHCNAFTAEDITAYVNSVPMNHLNMVLRLEADRMSQLTMTNDIFEIERKVIVEEYHTHMNNPVAKSFLEFREIFYDNHPYKMSPLGIIEDINSISLDDMSEYYKLWYRPDNANLVIVGDFKSEEHVFDQVEKYFGSIKQPDAMPIVEKQYPHDCINKENWMKRTVDFDVPILLTGYPSPASNSEDVLPLEILQLIVSQGETSRLNREIVRKKSIAVMAGGMNHSLKHAGMAMFFAVFTPDTSCKRVEQALIEQIEIVKNHRISDVEMEKVKNMTLSSRTFEMFSTEHICQRIGYAETVDGDYKMWVKKLDELARLQTDQLMDVAKKYWKKENRHTLYLKPKKVNPLLFAMGLIRRIMPKSK